MPLSYPLLQGGVKQNYGDRKKSRIGRKQSLTRIKTGIDSDPTKCKTLIEEGQVVQAEEAWERLKLRYFAKGRKQMTMPVNINRKKVADLFLYHPPVDPERKERHDRINAAAIDFALEMSEIVTDPAELTTMLRKIQECRMLAHQAVTFAAEGVRYRNIFESSQPHGEGMV